MEYNEHVADRYDGMSGGRYISGVLGLYVDGIITDDEIAPLSDEPCEFLISYKQSFE